MGSKSPYCAAYMSGREVHDYGLGGEKNVKGSDCDLIQSDIRSSACGTEEY
jgi:hypothetical protein